MRTCLFSIYIFSLSLAFCYADSGQVDRLQDRAQRDTPGVAGIAGRDAPLLLWNLSSSLFDHVRCVRGVDDVNGDGFGDALIAVEDLNVSDPDLYLYSGASAGSPTLIWSYNSTHGASGGSGYGDSCIAQSPDLNNDLQADFLYGLSWGGRTAVALSSTDSEIWYYDTYLTETESGWVYSIAALNDVNGDSVPDVISGAGSYCDSAWCLSGGSSGSITAPIWRYDAPDAVTAVAAINDVNGDGKNDALIGVGDSGYQAVCASGGSSGTATILWTYSSGSNSVYDVNSINDVNEDGIQDALIGLWRNSNNVICVSGASSGTATILWNVTATADYIMEVRPISDVNGDSKDDVLVGSWANRIICLSGADGSVIWSTLVGTLNGGDVWTIAPIGDQNNDGIFDVLAGSFDQNVYCCSGVDGEIIWNYATTHRIYSVHSIPDVNGDGIDDAIAGTQGASAYIYCFATQIVTPSPTPHAVPVESPAGVGVMLTMLGMLFIILLRR